MNFSTGLWNNWLIPKLYTATGPEAVIPIEEIFDKDGAKINLQIRDAKMLAMLFGAKFMTTNQLSLCFWHGYIGTDEKLYPERVCRRRLNTLWQYGLISRIRPRAKSTKGSLPWIWAITKKGVQVLERSGIPLYEERLKRESKFDDSSLELPSQILLRHAVLVAEFGSRCVAEGGDWYFEHETATAMNVPITNTKTKNYYPDAILEWAQQKGDKIIWLLELERSANQRRFREKMNIWRALKLLAKAEGVLGKQFVVMIGRIKDTTPDRDERSLLPLARILVTDGKLLDFVKFIGIPDESQNILEVEPMDAVSFLAKYDN